MHTAAKGNSRPAPPCCPTTPADRDFLSGSVMEGGSEMIALAKKLHRYPVNGKKRSLSEVAGALAKAGYLSSAGKPYTRMAILRMLERKCEAKRTP
ncbi:hypothetical protein ACC689_11155 [Rhizobium ruizarguesonis]